MDSAVCNAESLLPPFVGFNEQCIAEVLAFRQNTRGFGAGTTTTLEGGVLGQILQFALHTLLVVNLIFRLVQFCIQTTCVEQCCVCEETILLVCHHLCKELACSFRTGSNYLVHLMDTAVDGIDVTVVVGNVAAIDGILCSVTNANLKFAVHHVGKTKHLTQFSALAEVAGLVCFDFISAVYQTVVHDGLLNFYQKILLASLGIYIQKLFSFPGRVADYTAIHKMCKIVVNRLVGRSKAGIVTTCRKQLADL